MGTLEARQSKEGDWQLLVHGLMHFRPKIPVYK